MLRYDSLTPVKIRGKRSATSAEKWTLGKRRKPWLQRRIDPSVTNDQSAASPPADMTMASQQRRKRRCELSPLEDLPAEIGQKIFVLSGNLRLALSSPELSRMLTSEHLCERMATRLLFPVLGIDDQVDDREPTAMELADATRFLDTRFASWKWFCLWLQRNNPRRDEDQHHITEVDIWVSLRPSMSLMPPTKLLRGPFTDDSEEFLRLFAASAPRLTENPHYNQLAYEGLAEAIHEGREMAVDLLLEFGLKPNTEHLRHAVIDGGCNETIVELLISCHQFDYSDPSFDDSDFDVLDPELWTWIERAKSRDDPKGQWLMELLRAV